MTFLHLCQPLEVTYEVKRSKFIGYAELSVDRGQALDILSKRRKKYPDARHHCWAYLLGSTQQPKSMAMSDDGEPSGTAGKPILNVLQHNEVGNIMIVISRYFGGIKLGAGGLVRAYSSATQQLIDNVTTEAYIAKTHFTLECSYQQEQLLRHMLKSIDADIINVEFTMQVCLLVSVSLAQEAALRSICATHQINISVQ